MAEEVEAEKKRADRTLAAIMFTDMVGYTALSQTDEALALEVLRKHNQLLRSIFPKFHGSEIKTIGDSFLVEFDSALDATLCAIEIQKLLHDYNTSAREDWKTKLRIGIHLGDVVHERDDILGDAVNIASRIQQLASPEGICISQQVFDQIHNKTSYQFDKLARAELKNVKFKTNAYSVVLPWESRSREVDNRSQEELDRLRVAVLPFTNISSDHTDEYFADGLTEELISKLSLVKGLMVIARTSIMSYKNKEKKISEIGSELRVGTVVEGSVRKAGNKLRITAQLIDTRSEGHLWAENYDRDLNDIFAIQTDVASKIAESLSSTGVFSKVKKREDTTNVNAYTSYLRAVQLYHENTEQSLRESVKLFEKAISLDGNFVRAYAGLSHSWARLVFGGYEDFSAIDKAYRATKKALELGPDFAEAHAAMAQIAGTLDRFGESLIEAEKAVQINPNLSEAHMNLGILHCNLDDLQSALSSFEKAYELDPLSVVLGVFVAIIAQIAGRKSLALGVLERMRDLNPQNERVYVAFANYYITEGNFAEAKAMLDKGKSINPSDPLLKVNQGILYALTGRRKEAEETLEEILQDEIEGNRLRGEVFIHSALGNFDQAYRALARQAETHSWDFLIRFRPVFDGLRKDARYADFCKKLGIPQ